MVSALIHFTENPFHRDIFFLTHLLRVKGDTFPFPLHKYLLYPKEFHSLEVIYCAFLAGLFSIHCFYSVHFNFDYICTDNRLKGYLLRACVTGIRNLVDAVDTETSF